MAEEEKPVKIPFRVEDLASRAIEKIAKGVEKLSDHVDESLSKLTEMGAALAGIAGGLSFERMIDTGKESLEQINKLNKLTGVSADNIAAMRDVFEQSGLQAEQLGATMTAISKKALSMDLGSKNLITEAKQWGVELNKGPMQAFYSLSESVQKHKIDMAGVAQLTRTSGEATGAMMELLGKGPEELKKMIEESRKLNISLADPEALENFVKFHEASTKIHEAFRRISEKVVVQLAPALANLSDRFSHWIDTVDVKKFIDPLVHGMEFVVAHARELAKIMAANSLLSKATGTGLSGTLLKVGSKAFGMGGKVGGGIGSMIATVGTSMIPGGVGKLLGPLSSVAPMLLKLVGGITGIGLVAGAIFLVIKHLDYFKAKLMDVGKAIWASIQKIWGALSHMFSADTAIGKFVREVGEVLMTALQKVGTWIAKILSFVADAINFASDAIEALASGKRRGEVHAERERREQMEKLSSSGYDKYMAPQVRQQVASIDKMIASNQQLSDAQIKIYQGFVDAAEKFGVQWSDKDTTVAAFKKRYNAPKAPEGSAAPTGNGVYQDFRGSRFDIEQKFAEGFDPDRIAVGFANDIAKLGEKRLASNLSPVNAVR